ncbi:MULTISPECIES: DUF61 family protein [Acidianus]|uniref:DUF61 domain-containing protein n=1 Tax=Candidatus Acidianus copahuensis TaxID=1160895 RepID=A0A031LME0_9CREN|nr:MULTISPECIES: DUF61 family protein [Acidianus]EZQ06808.1 hypothetical protein CM19_05380 [Candidatus Acidianus copahuensis]NON61819.1 DUF61 family protein [Acidianus sp. RZ1]
MLDKIINLGLRDILSGLPSERVSIKDAVEGKLAISLNNGLVHTMEKKQVEEFSRNVPLYLWSLVKIPIILAKLPDPGEYSVSGSEWDVKALSYVLGREISTLYTPDVEELLKKYRTLIFITLGSNIFSLEDSSNEGM